MRARKKHDHVPDDWNGVLKLTAYLLVSILLAVAAYAVAVSGGQADSKPSRGFLEGPVATSDLPADHWYKLAVKRKKLLEVRELQRNHARGQLRALLRRLPPVSYAIRLASVIYGVPESHLHRVASCESGHNPRARNGIYRGVYQEGPMFERGPFGRAGFSVWDPLANVLTAGYTVSREGWRQWACKP